MKSGIVSSNDSEHLHDMQDGETVMKRRLAAIAFGTLGACAAPMPEDENTSDYQGITTVILPLDPGQVSCAQINSEPQYAPAILPWVSGQIMAAIFRGEHNLSGESSVNEIQIYCASRPDDLVSDITQNVIGILN
ncbi:MAG: hypothetical protein QNL92_10315 [Octadecabacter sp.]